MNTQIESVINVKNLVIATLLISLLTFVGQCRTSSKLSALQYQNEVLTKQVDEIASKHTMTPEEFKAALQESMYQQLTIQEQVNKGKITAEQMQKNLSDIQNRLSEIKKTSEKNERPH